ncbi:phage/plasmid primase, P4 family [Acetonema longum]|uniref:phage/plasmid primase, P4 family n=1 Tax=Acetonema longum TaxID=2374 RepID=UPI00145F71CE|nr:phage/plasmid primase, P4 family [Acetonema longum]
MKGVDEYYNARINHAAGIGCSAAVGSLAAKAAARQEKPDKVPYNPKSGRQASIKNPATWGTYEEALSLCSREGMAGVGFVFKENDPYCGIDIDNCLNERGEISTEAAAIVRELDSYTEVSPSGNGLHILVKAALSSTAWHKQKGVIAGGDIEMYSTGRYFTVTGKRWPGSPADVNHRGEEIAQIQARYAGQEQPKAAEPDQDFDLSAYLPDEEVLRRARAAKDGEKFTRLYDRGDTSLHGGDDSAADLALCLLLAFWTQNPEQIDRLFRESKLFRDKWDAPRGDCTYGEITIKTALRRQTARYDPNFRQVPVDVQELQRLFAATPMADRLSDMGNSARFAAMFKDAFRYCPTLGPWLVWDGCRWQADDTGAVMAAADDCVIATAQVAAAQDDPDKRGKWLSFAAKNEALAKRQAMVTGAQHLPALAARQDQFDQNSWLFNCLNGTLDLKTGALMPHNPSDYITKIAPVNYDPSAECPRFMQFLTEVFPDDMGLGIGNTELISFVQRLAGYALAGVTTEQILCIAHGSGANGKSTLINLLADIMGDYATTTPTDAFLMQKGQKPTHDLAALRGARFVIASETQEGKRLDEPLIKQLTGGDKIAARFLYKASFTYSPQFLIVLLTNHMPRAKAEDGALWRRIRLLPFEVKFESVARDNNLAEKLKQEMDGVFRWMVEGCLRWQKEGLGEPEEVTRATAQYREENDSLGDWIAERCELDAKATARTTELRDDYQRYNGWRRIEPKIFTQMLKARDFKVKISHGISKAYGIRLKPAGVDDFLTEDQESES